MENTPHIYIKNQFTEADLVAFGNYLLGTYRIESYQATDSEIPVEERLASVHQEDIDNWKASIKTSSTVKAYVVSKDVPTEPEIDNELERVLKSGIERLTKQKEQYQQEIKELMDLFAQKEYGNVGMEIFTDEFRKELVKWLASRIYNIDLEIERKKETLLLELVKRK